MYFLFFSIMIANPKPSSAKHSAACTSTAWPHHPHPPGLWAGCCGAKNSLQHSFPPRQRWPWERKNDPKKCRPLCNCAVSKFGHWCKWEENQENHINKYIYTINIHKNTSHAWNEAEVTESMASMITTISILHSFQYLFICSTLISFRVPPWGRPPSFLEMKECNEKMAAAREKTRAKLFHSIIPTHFFN